MQTKEYGYSPLFYHGIIIPFFIFPLLIITKLKLFELPESIVK